MKIQSERAVPRMFFGKPMQLDLYQKIREYVESLGPLKIKVVKTQVSFAKKRQFAWVWLPMKWDKKRPPNCVVLSFGLRRRINNPKIVEIVEPYPGRWIHHVIINSKSDLNTDVQDWLNEAYDYGDGDKSC